VLTGIQQSSVFSGSSHRSEIRILHMTAYFMMLVENKTTLYTTTTPMRLVQ